MNRSVNITRQEFLKKSGQVLLASGLSVLGLVLGFRRTDTEANAEGCILQNPCSGCGRFQACGDPKALAVKAESAEVKESTVQEKKYE